MKHNIFQSRIKRNLKKIEFSQIFCEIHKFVLFLKDLIKLISYCHKRDISFVNDLLTTNIYINVSEYFLNIMFFFTLFIIPI